MNVKRYLADDVSEAMAQIREELGLDAFILNQRTIRRKGFKGLFKKPMVEVVAAYEPKEQRSAPRSVPPLTAPRRYTVPDTPPLQSARENAAVTSVIPPAPAAIAAYMPQQRRSISEQPAPAETAPMPVQAAQKPPEDDGFRPLFVRNDAKERATDTEQDRSRMAALESKIDALSTAISGLTGKIQISKDGLRGGYPQAVDALLLSLIENDVNEEFAHKLARETADILSKQDVDPREVMEQVLRQTIGEPAPVRLKRFKRSVVLLVGPTGVGKTTTLAKLAAIYQLNHHAKVGLITADTYRIAAVEQLKTYAEILEIPLSIVYNPADVTDALKEHADKDVVFIDTAGKSPSDRTMEEEITSLIKNSECDEVHLVISATTGFTGLLNIISHYGFLRDYKVLFTKLDETPSWGAVLNAKFLTDKPVSYLAFGQNVPDDIEVMAPRKLIDRLMPSEKT